MPGSDGRIKGPSDERAQARERLRRRLLDAARALATEHGGYDAVTVRAVASRVGYAAPVVYQYFSNKHDLLVAVVDTGFAELAERLGRAQCRNKTDMLLATAEEYWAFAMAEPYLYRLMHGLGGVPFGEPNTPKSALDCFHLLAAAAGTRAPGRDQDTVTDLFWAQLHGLVTLTLDGRIKGGPTRAQRLLPDLVAAYT
ncbi:TetR/AcrR family transcriptional regulator [Actinomadura madurae]|uniref:DNA-binding transcriptional regulator, AcrR family n=1 Tax=Actinomadura madurae TaxID=1993 RepID=A0A1I5M2A4_9ACTN|nr:TetR/AcrR family transcriptional regulator [Actinomadura madurae]SFP03734.1 DNA-binding transcriptional regulator, AcrR family [Actinomadura madurae]SPT52295.1 HTH-type transcriptional repressor KstR [Actinomadura madurae]